MARFARRGNVRVVDGAKDSLMVPNSEVGDFVVEMTGLCSSLCSQVVAPLLVPAYYDIPERYDIEEFFRQCCFCIEDLSGEGAMVLGVDKVQKSSLLKSTDHFAKVLFGLLVDFLGDGEPETLFGSLTPFLRCTVLRTFRHCISLRETYRTAVDVEPPFSAENVKSLLEIVLRCMVYDVCAYDDYDEQTASNLRKEAFSFIQAACTHPPFRGSAGDDVAAQTKLTLRSLKYRWYLVRFIFLETSRGGLDSVSMTLTAISELTLLESQPGGKLREPMLQNALATLRLQTPENSRDPIQAQLSRLIDRLIGTESNPIDKLTLGKS